MKEACTAEDELIAAAAEALAGVGLRVRTVERLRGDHGVEHHVEVLRDGQRRRYAVEVSRIVRPSSVATVVDRVRSVHGTRPVLLVAEQVSSETAELLRQRRIEFIDTAGNAYLDNPDFLVVISGERAASTKGKAPADRVGVAALQVAFALLRDEDAARLSVRALGERAGVSHGAAAAAILAFDGRGWVRNLGRKGQPVVDAEGLLTTWMVGFANQLGPKLEVARAAPPGAESPSAWAQNIRDQLSPAVALLGGEAAAELAGHDIRGSTASVYVRSWDAQTMKALRLVPAREGQISVRSAFAPHMEDPSDHRLVDPLVVLAEVAAIPDERLDRVRAALRALVASRMRR